MLQDATPDLTKFVPPWVPYFIVVVGTLVYVGERIWKLVKRGRAGQSEDQQKEIAAAVEKYKTAAEEFKVVAESRAERIKELQQENQDAEAEVSRLRQDAELKRRITDRLQSEVFELQGDVDRLRERLSGVKGARDEG